MLAHVGFLDDTLNHGHHHFTAAMTHGTHVPTVFDGDTKPPGDALPPSPNQAAAMWAQRAYAASTQAAAARAAAVQASEVAAEQAAAAQAAATQAQVAQVSAQQAAAAQVGSTMAVATPVGTPAPAAASSAALALSVLFATGWNPCRRAAA